MRDWLGFSGGGKMAMGTTERHVAAPLTILIVDSSGMRRTMLKRVMQLSGIPIATIVEATDRAEALTLLTECSIDVLFVGVDAPGGDGMELLRAVRAHGEWNRVVRIATASTDDDDRQAELKGLRCRGALRTPFLVEGIRAVLWDLIGGGAEAGAVH